MDLRNKNNQIFTTEFILSVVKNLVLFSYMKLSSASNERCYVCFSWRCFGCKVKRALLYVFSVDAVDHVYQDRDGHLCYWVFLYISDSRWVFYICYAIFYVPFGGLTETHVKFHESLKIKLFSLLNLQLPQTNSWIYNSLVSFINIKLTSCLLTTK